MHDRDKCSKNRILRKKKNLCRLPSILSKKQSEMRIEQRLELRHRTHECNMPTGWDTGARLLMLVGLTASKSKMDWMMKIIYESILPHCKQASDSSLGKKDVTRYSKLRLSL